MSRPLSESIPYYSHDTDMSEDENLQKVEFKYGLNGYAIYNKILERVYKTNGMFNLISEDDYKMYSEKWRIESPKLHEIILYMREVKLFPSENFISNGVRKRIKKIQQERKRKRNYIKNKQVAKEIIDVYNPAIISPLDGLSTTKVKESKVKESKIDNIPELSEFMTYAKTIPIYHPSYDFQIEAKYNQWKEDKWKDGNNKLIKNWKTKLQNTMPYFKKDNMASSQQTVLKLNKTGAQ